MTVDDLLQVVPQLISRIDSLETDLKQTKLTMGNALVKLVKKVKKLEGFLKRRNVVLSDSEEEEPEAQGRKINAFGEEQVEDISPNTLEAAKTLTRVASLKPKSIDKGRRYKKRKETKGKKVVSSLVFQEEVDAGAKEVNTAEGVNTGSIKLSTVSEQEQILQEEASLTEAIRLDTLQKEEVAKQVHLDSLLAQRIAGRTKIEANAELSKSMLGSDLQGEDFAKKMVDLGTWKLSQLKNLSFEEVKEEFDKLVKQVESFAPINFEATKASLKRFGEELQTKTTKRLKDEEAKDVEPTKNEQDDSVSGTKIPINHVLVAMKSPSIATYKIIKQGEKGVYQIVREDGTDIVYINFGAMLKDISRDDLTELYRIVMNRYGMDGPEDELEKYPLSAEVCKAMLDKKLQGGKPDENCYKMLKMMEKQAGIRKHKDWLVQEQTALGKDFSNPFYG
ncbi:hypothetical protein Tco_0470785 [Tanacetum coccineum]